MSNQQPYEQTYPYFTPAKEPTWEGEVPNPEPVGYGADPGLSMAKANADHVHAINTESGTIVSSKGVRYYGGWSGGNISAQWYILGNVPAMSFRKRFGGTNLLFQMGASAFVTGAGWVAIAASPTNVQADLCEAAHFYFNNVSVHQTITGYVEVAGRAAADYNITWWATGNAIMGGDNYDIFWGRVWEVWP